MRFLKSGAILQRKMMLRLGCLLYVTIFWCQSLNKYIIQQRLLCWFSIPGCTLSNFVIFNSKHIRYSVLPNVSDESLFSITNLSWLFLACCSFFLSRITVGFMILENSYVHVFISNQTTSKFTWKFISLVWSHLMTSGSAKLS